MINISNSTNVLEISKVPGYLKEKTGKRPHIATIYRWIKTGLCGIRLETLWVGGSQVTSAEALDLFFAETTKARQRHTEKLSINRSANRLNIVETQAEREGI